MADINQEMEHLVAEMKEIGQRPVLGRGGDWNDLLRYKELREQALKKFLPAFAAGYRLALTRPNEPLTCAGCYYLDRDPAPCAYCIRSAGYADYYRRPPEEGEEI